MKFLIDAGHGGSDPGAIGPTGIKEKDVTLPVSVEVGRHLKRLGQEVIYSRTSDIYVALQQRTDLANAQKVDYLISVHCNSLNAAAHGTETWCFASGKPGESLAKGIQAELIKANGLTDRGVKYCGSGLHMIRESHMPAALTEMAFISNPTEEKLLKDPANQKKYALDIAKGICKATGIKWVDEQPIQAIQPAVQKKPQSIIQKLPVGYMEFIPEENRAIWHLDEKTYISLKPGCAEAYAEGKEPKQII